jgi:hypothetical protein
MGRGNCSKAIRMANRAAQRGKMPAGANHSTVPGKKWTRKDVLHVRETVQFDLLHGLIDNSHIEMSKTMKQAPLKQDISKKDLIKSIKVMKPVLSNAE